MAGVSTALSPPWKGPKGGKWQARTAGSYKSNFKEIKSCQRNKTSKRENPYEGKLTQKDRLQKPRGRGWLRRAVIDLWVRRTLGCRDLLQP